MLTPCNTIRGCLLDSERPNFWNPEKGKDCMLYHNLLAIDNYIFYDIRASDLGTNQQFAIDFKQKKIDNNEQCNVPNQIYD